MACACVLAIGVDKRIEQQLTTTSDLCSETFYALEGMHNVSRAYDIHHNMSNIEFRSGGIRELTLDVNEIG